MTLIYPNDAGQRGCILLPLDIALVPIIAGQLAGLRRRRAWTTESDYSQGYTALAELYICMTSTCVADLTAAVDRLYRLIDATVLGASYVVQETDPVLVIYPPIPNVPDTLAPTPDSLLGLLRALPGVLDGGWFGFGSRPATLADIVDALRATAPETTTTLFEQARDLLGQTSDVAAIGNFAAGLLDEGTDVVGDAGTALMIALLGASQTAMSQQLALRLDRLIAALDGGGAAPSDNVLTALRGSTPAGAERNVIDALINNGAGAVTPADIDRVIAELQQIRGTL